MLLEHMQI